jgi:UDP-2,4-diacetamido-2,4,6-trideoxy-beta-L-altropyranose hydrolase
LPTVLTVLADNQKEIAKRLVDEGAAISLGCANELAPTAVVETLRKFDCDPIALAALTTRSAVICDGRGAQRVAMQIQPARAADGKSVWLRPGTWDDLEVTYEWQVQPETRRFMRNKASPTHQEHSLWLAARLNDQDCLFNIIVYDGEPAGSLRLDRLDASGFEISVVVGSAFRARGIGLAALTLAAQLVPEAELRAEILLGNDSSEALFTKAGFMPKGYGWRYLAARASSKARSLRSERQVQ